MDFSSLIFERLGKKHARKSFSCEVPQLNEYLQTRANQKQKKSIANIFVLTDRGGTEIKGYNTLSSYGLLLRDLPEDIARKLPRYPLVGTTLIGRLARDLRYKGQDLGELLLMDALSRSFDASHSAASWAVVVDAKDDKVKFFLSEVWIHSIGK